MAPTKWQPPDPQADLQTALEHAKWVLARALHSPELRQVQDREIVSGFYAELRHALQDLTAAVEAATKKRGEPK